jgi:hypothetical protein
MTCISGGAVGVGGELKRVWVELAQLAVNISKASRTLAGSGTGLQEAVLSCIERVDCVFDDSCKLRGVRITPRLGAPEYRQSPNAARP